MCGIAGIVSIEHGLEPNSEQRLRMMLAMQRHRGPDDTGIYSDLIAAVGANRLSILDPTSRGHMPMSDGSGQEWLVYNGEIYNFIELRGELEALGHVFRSGSDTEVLLGCLSEYGIEALEKLRGMFAFAWWRPTERRLVLARDRIGIKPLYFTYGNGVLRFASEAKALVDGAAKPDLSVLDAYLFGAAPPAPRLADATFFDGIASLAPGQVALLDEDGLTIRTYWQLPVVKPSGEHDDLTVDELDEVVVESVRLHLRSDTPVGSYLSGGLDSTLIASIAAAELGSLPTFSGLVPTPDPRFNERRWIDQALARIPGEHHAVTIDAEGWWSDLLPMVWFLDHPVAGPASVAQYAVAKLAAQHVKVVLGGQGGDELFAGYYRHLWAHARDLRSRGDLPALVKGLPSLGRVVADLGPRTVAEKFHRHAVVSGLLSHQMRGEREVRAAETPSPESNLRRTLRSDMTRYLPGLLHVEDRASMAASVESRVPLLDHTLVEAAWPYGGKSKLPGFELKAQLRRVAARHVAPAIVARRDKRGFPLPTGDWFRGPLRQRLAEVLDSDSVTRHGVFSRSKLRQLIKQHERGRFDGSIPLWTALAVELWFATYVDRDGSTALTE